MKRNKECKYLLKCGRCDKYSIKCDEKNKDVSCRYVPKFYNDHDEMVEYVASIRKTDVPKGRLLYGDII